MSTFGTMKTRIATELDRSDLTSPIADAVVSAIAYFSTYRFWFNERTITFTTVDGQDEYTLPTVDTSGLPIRVLEIDQLIFVDSGGSRYVLQPKPWQYINAQKWNTTDTGKPDLYSIHHGKIILWPIPDGAYTIDGSVLADINQITSSSAANVTNEWMTVGEEMIRCRAKGDLYENTIRNPERAGAMLGIASAAMQRLQSQTDRLKNVGGVTPWY